jgi:putative glycosyltransferase
MKLSIVATLYRSAAYIEEFCRRAHAAAEALVGDDHEIVLVNDGSPDNSLDIAVTLARRDPRLTVVDLSRNFGHHKAMMTGLSQARGELVYLLDVDLEEEPEWLAPFAERMHSEGCDVVYGVQQQRKGSFYERWSGALFYTVFRTLSGLDFPRNITTARLMTRRYVDALLGHKEREIMIAGLWLITGFASGARPRRPTPCAARSRPWSTASPRSATCRSRAFSTSALSCRPCRPCMWPISCCTVSCFRCRSAAGPRSWLPSGSSAA